MIDAAATASEELRRSSKFLAWKPYRDREKSLLDSLKARMMAEKHYEPSELADLWGVSAETIRSIFRDEPGVLKIGKTGARYKRGYITLRIPESVAERVHTRLSA
jgi:hypothetical protein